MKKYLVLFNDKSDPNKINEAIEFTKKNFKVVNDQSNAKFLKFISIEIDSLDELKLLEQFGSTVVFEESKPKFILN